MATFKKGTVLTKEIVLAVTAAKTTVSRNATFPRRKPIVPDLDMPVFRSVHVRLVGMPRSLPRLLECGGPNNNRSDVWIWQPIGKHVEARINVKNEAELTKLSDYCLACDCEG